jgi:hypothetical protein
MYLLFRGLGLAVLLGGLCGSGLFSPLCVTAAAQNRYNRNQPDFYTRPKVSPYLDMLNPLLGPLPLRYQIVKQQQETREGIKQGRRAIEQQQLQLQDQDRKLEEQERKAAVGKPGAAPRGALEDPRVGGPQRRSPFGDAYGHPQKGHSQTTRSTGHPVRFADPRVLNRSPRQARQAR